MPKRIGFHVIFATSEEPGYPACELNVQAPSARGWRSGVDSSAPHELLLRLHARAVVHKLQLLAHHHLIPSSIEVLVYDPGEDGTTAQTPCGAAYTSVGHVALAPPSATNDTRLRELRSAALPEPTSAKFIKLRLSAPHDTTDDTQQVALMGVNVLGTEVLEAEILKADNEAKYSPYDDLAFTMYVDAEIADIIRRLDEKKQIAIAEERFEYASKLKACCSALGAAGLRLGRWRLRKRLAAAADAFERARSLRDRLVSAVAAIRGDPLLTRLLEEDGVKLKNDESHPEAIDFTPHLSQPTSNLSFDIPSPPTATASRKSIPINTTDLNSADSEEQYIQITAEMNFYKDDQTDLQHNENLKPKRIIEESIKRRIDAEIQRPYNESLKLKLGPDDRPCYNEARSRASNAITNGKNEEMGRVGILTKVTGVDHGCERQIRLDPGLMEGDRDSPARSISPTNANRNGEITRSGSSPGGVRGAGGVVVRRRNKSAGPPGAPNRSSYEAHEERPIPALRHSHTNEYLRDCQHIEPEPRVTPRMSERDRKQAALPILIFGQHLVDKFYSKHYADKEEGLHRLRDALREWTEQETVPRNTSPNKTARAAVALLHRALKDKVSSVYSLATELVRFFFQEFVPGRVCASEVGRSVEKLLPELLAKSGDTVPRIHSTAQHTILTMAECPAVRSLHIIPQQLVRPMSAATAPRLALSKFQMLEQLLLTHGFSTDKNSGLTVRRVAEAGAAGAAHAAAAVRAVAERVLLASYARCPRLVRAQLPPDDAVSRRNLLYRHLFQQFDKIDTQVTSVRLIHTLAECVLLVQNYLGKRPTHEQFLNGTNQQLAPDINGGGDFVDLSNIGFKESTHASSLMGESIGSSLTTTSQNSSTLSRTSTNTKSSLKKTPSKKYNIMKDTSNYPGYNKLRLDSAISPKHSPRMNKTVQDTLTSERVHFNETVTSQSLTNTVVYRNINRNTDNRHSMIDFDHQKEFKPELKERPISVCDPGQLVSRISRGVSDSNHSLYRESYSSSPSELTNKISVLSVGAKSVKLDDSRQMEESGYYSPVETSCRRGSRKGGPVAGEYCDGVDGDIRSVGSSHSGGTTPEGNYREDVSMCAWCLAAVIGEQMDAHYWRQCHLLARCPACRLVLEARVLHRHLAEECSDRHLFGVCQRCEAVLSLEELHRHSAGNAACHRATEDEWKCPHCLSNIPASEDAWRIHLTSQCGSNPRIQ